jgi:alkyl hydroperoxide reductase subunit AhpF
MMKNNLLHGRLVRCLILLLGGTVTGAAVPIPELTVRTVVPAPTTEQQLAQLQQQVQSLQAQLAALQAIVKITPASTAGQEPTVKIEAGTVVLRASNNLTMMSGSNTSIKASGDLDLQSSTVTRLRTFGPLFLDGSSVRFNGGNKGLATVGSVVQTGSPNGVLSGQIMNGSANVYSN